MRTAKLFFAMAVFSLTVFNFSANISAEDKLCKGSVKCTYQNGCYIAECTRWGEGCNRTCGFLEFK
jgi:hypothetical protein